MSGPVTPIGPRLSTSGKRRQARLLDEAAMVRQREFRMMWNGAARLVRTAAAAWKYSGAPLRAAEYLERVAQVLRELHALGEQYRALGNGAMPPDEPPHDRSA